MDDQENTISAIRELEYAVAALSVLDALETVDEDSFVAAYVETTASDYLIWVDRERSRLVAAFANAGEYFGQNRKRYSEPIR